MTIAEPATLVTDYLLGSLAAFCAWRLMRETTPAVRWWGAALAAVAAASVAGGTYHGFSTALSAPAAQALWKATTITMGIASFFLLASTFTASFGAPRRHWLVAAAAVKLAVYVVWMLWHDDFAFVVYEYGSTLLLVLMLSVAGRVNGSSGHRARIIGGIVVSIAAALLQQSGIRLHRQFNHNDLMHVVQMAGVWLLYQGGARLRDAGELHAGRS